MAYNKIPTLSWRMGKSCANVDSKPHIHGGRPRLWLQIYKEIITAQIFKQKIWHMTTSSEIFLKIVKGGRDEETSCVPGPWRRCAEAGTQLVFFGVLTVRRDT